MSADAKRLLDHLNSLNLPGGDYVVIGQLLALFDGDEARTLLAMNELSRLGIAIVAPGKNAIMLLSGSQNSN